MASRKAQVDDMRAMATIGVVSIHAVAGYFLSAFGSLSWHGFNALDALCRYAVPLFLMISGMFHVGNDRYSFRSFFAKALKLFFVYTFWQLMYMLLTDKPLCIKSWIAPHYHLWFLPVIALLYIATPLLNRWVKMGRFWVVYALVFLLMGAYSLYTGSVIRNISVLSLIGCASYYVLGYQLQRATLPQNKWLWASLLLVSWLITAMGTCYLSQQAGQVVECFYAYAMPNVLLGSVALFVLCMQTSSIKKGIVHKMLMPLSNYSFGIYLIHPFFIAMLYNSPYLEAYPVVKCLLTIVLSLGGGWLISWLISKIPYLSATILK